MGEVLYEGDSPAVTKEALEEEKKAIEERHPSTANLAPLLAAAEDITVTEAEAKLDEAQEAGQPTAQGKVEAAKEGTPKEAGPPKATTAATDKRVADKK